MVLLKKKSILPTVAEEPETIKPSIKKQYKASLRKDPEYTPSSRKNRHRSSTAGSTSTNCLDKIADRKTRRQIARLGPLIQLCLLFTILVLVLQSESQASFTAEQLRRFKEEESGLVLQLQRIERHSIALHENIRTQLRRAGMEDSVDPLGEQTAQLYEMTRELSHQAETLQERITEDSINQIVQEYGEGPAMVVIELEFLDGNFVDKETYPKKDMQLSMFLWPDTPHAIWVWLEQIERHVWDDAFFEWDTKDTVLKLSPSEPDPLKRGHLQFVEHHNNPHLHGAWTIGLRQNDESGQLQMFINLQDNSNNKKHETCIGKILDGYDAIQRLLEAKREVRDFSVVHVKRVNAMHMTQREIDYY